MLLVWIRTADLRLSLTRVEMNLAYPMSSPTRIGTNSDKALKIDAAFLRLLLLCVCCIFSLFDIGNAIKSIRSVSSLSPRLVCTSAAPYICGATSITDIMPSKVPFSSLTPIVPTQPPRAGESSLSAQSTSVSPASAPRLKRVSANASNNSSAGAVPNEELLCHTVFSLLHCHDAVRSSTKVRFRLIDSHVFSRDVPSEH
ncbi:hypothetical protein CI102_4076 [Trichoderma harzianum]|nr:hypothetical protein CI102_4076 [Trichoderma harzianum]